MTNNLKFYRTLRGYTQQYLADCCCVSRINICSIESGKSLPSITLAFKLASFLLVPITSLFDFSDDFTIYLEVW